MPPIIRYWIFNFCILLNSFLLIMLATDAHFSLPPFLQVLGRIHPLLIHFPVVLAIAALFTETICSKRKDLLSIHLADIVLLVATLSAGLSSFFGWILSQEEGYTGDELIYHKWTAFIFSVLLLLWFGFRNSLRRRMSLTLLAGMPALCSMLLAAHAGGSLTHGTGFVTAPLAVQKEIVRAPWPEALSFRDLVQPILQTKCVQCHSQRKAKGELKLETMADLLKGGKNGALWDTTLTGFGLMMDKIHLPLADEEHMPPEGKPQLTTAEISTLYYWIKAGAPADLQLSTLPPDDSLAIVAKSFFTNESEDYKFEAADVAVINKLNSANRSVHPIAIGSPALRVAFYGAAFFKPEQLAELTAIKDQLVELQLSHVPVRDEDLNQLAGFSQLRKLNLAFTDVSTKSLPLLAALPALKELVLSGTKLDRAALESLKKAKKLTDVYLWETGLSAEELTALSEEFKSIRFYQGFDGDTVLAKLNPPVFTDERQVFADTMAVRVKHYLPSVQLRYTLDGTVPDSINSPLLNDVLILKNSSELTVKAFLPGWISSEKIQRAYYKTAVLADSVSLRYSPNKEYAARQGRTLSDAELGTMDFRDGKWLGFQENPLDAVFSFQSPIKISEFYCSILNNPGSYIFPPARVELYGGNNPAQLKKLAVLQPPQPSSLIDPAKQRIALDFPATECKYIRVVISPVNALPSWHPGKGSKGWVFVDEVFFQ